MQKLNFKISPDGKAAYLYLPSHPQKNVAGVSVKQLFLEDLISGYQGPDVILDFDSNGIIIGIEILLD